MNKKKDIFDKIMEFPGFHRFQNIYKRYKEFLLYVFFGIFTAVVSIGSYGYCEVIMGIDPLISNVISWILAVTFAYVTNKLWVFNVEISGAKALFLQIFHFYSGRFFTLLVEEAMLFVFITKLKFNSIAVKISAQIVVVSLNYIISKLIVFRKRG